MLDGGYEATGVGNGTTTLGQLIDGVTVGQQHLLVHRETGKYLTTCKIVKLLLSRVYDPIAEVSQLLFFLIDVQWRYLLAYKLLNVRKHTPPQPILSNIPAV